MRTVTFKSILDWLARRMLGSENNLSQEFAAAYADAVGSAVRECWEREFWSEWTVTEQRYFRDVWTAGTYPQGTEVYYAPGDSYYRALVSTSATPGTDPTKWEIPGVNGAAPLDRYVSHTQTLQTPIDKVKAIHGKSPVQYPGACLVGFDLSPNGIQVQASALNSVWLTFRKVAPQFTSVLYDATAVYVTGDLVYHAATGDCWQATANSTGQTPADGSADWERQAIPYSIAEAVKRFAFAELLIDDGQEDKASGAAEDAEDLLANEWAKEEGQQGQVRTFGVLTRCAA